MASMNQQKQGPMLPVTDVSKAQSSGAPAQSFLRDERVDKILTRQKRLIFYVQTCTFVSLILIIGVLLGFVIYLGRMLMSSYRNDVPLSGLSKEIRYLDEVLTASVRMAAFTGDSTWETRYNEHVGPITDCIHNVQKIAPDIAAEFLALTGVANDKLIALEAQTFNISRHNTTAAINIVLGPTYTFYKAQLSQGLLLLDGDVGDKISHAYSNAQSFSQSAAISTGIISSLAILVCCVLFYATNRHSQEDKAEIFKIMVRLHNAAANTAHTRDTTKINTGSNSASSSHTGSSRSSTAGPTGVNVRLTGANRVHDEHSASRRSSNGSAGSAESHKSHETSASRPAA